MPRRLVTQQQAADHVWVTPRTIRNWIGQGLIPGYRVGPRRILVDLNDVEGMLATIPTVRDGRKPYGPKSNIIRVPAMPQVVNRTSTSNPATEAAQ